MSVQCKLLKQTMMFFFSLFCRLKDKMSVYTVFAIFSFLIGGSGVILNFLVCLVYFTTPRLLDAPNIFILNIAVGDLTYSVVALPMLVASNVRGEWAFGAEGCTAYGFLTTFLALGSMMHLAGAAYERYFTICKLFNDGQAQFSRKKAIFLSGILWCYALFWSLVPACGWSSYVLEGIGTSCSVDWTSKEIGNVSYTVCLMLACFVLPVAVMVYCYCKTHKALVDLSKQAVQNWGENSRATRDTLQAERKMVWITIAITAGFLIAWTPYALASIVAILKPGMVNDIGASIPAYIAKSSACYNPIIYVFMYRKVRSRLVGILYCRCSRVQPVVGSANTELATHEKTAGARGSRNQATNSSLSPGGPR